MSNDTGRDPLRALARHAGVLERWVDNDGREHTVGAEAMLAVLGAFGEALAGPADAAALLDHRRAEQARQWTEPVVVVWDGRDGHTLLRVPERHRNALIACRLDCEDGRVFEWNVRPGPASGQDTHRLTLPREIPLGYHRLRLDGGGTGHEALVVAAPTRGAAGRPHRRGAHPELGVFLPLYAATSAAHPAMGTLAELDRLGRFAHDHGATVVATLPLLSGFAAEPTVDSPYLPVSRRFFHEIWIDTDAVPDARGGGPPPSAPGDRRIDRRAVMARTRAVLDACADTLATIAPERDRAFAAFLDQHPEVRGYACFRAAGEAHGVNWRAWPEAWRRGRIDPADLDPAAVRRWAYAQWILHTQLHEVAARAHDRGQVLALDLPLGVHPDGYDVWAGQDQYLHGLSVGAPPDGFFTRGQSWGFPPPNPVAVRHTGHAGWRAALAAHLRVGRLLRIDHVMGLQRVFCVPDGMDPTDGAYVTMPAEELFAVVCLEAFRHHADVYGEDLGTVDPAVREAMARHGLRRSHVAQFSVRNTPEPAAFAPLEPAPAGSVASFGTHDLPTFAGWWGAGDVAERQALGHMDAGEADAAREQRAAQRRVLARLVPGVDPDDTEPPAAVLEAVHRELMAGDAGIVVVSVEDLLMEPDAQNLPGTSDERPNWRVAASRSLDEIATGPAVGPALDALQAPRRRTMTAADDYVRPAETITGISLLSDDDLHLFNEGRHFRLHEKLGAHLLEADGVPGTYFAVWAPNADAVSVVGDFDGWDDRRHPLAPRGSSGIWEGFVPGVGRGARYKYRLRTPRGEILEKADPFAFACETPPQTASVVWDLGRRWHDDEWMHARAAHQGPRRPMSIYEVHLGSWMRDADQGNRWLTYRELAPRLAAHVKELGFTHVELLPVMEHPFFGSWGYQVTGYFAPTARYGTPDDFMAFVEHLHQEGVGVILDWVPSHFPSDAHGLGRFDGTHLYEHEDERQRVHPDWQSWIFNYDRHEVRSFLVSNAVFWLERYHADGLRVDAVASMLYLDYSRAEGEWVPNQYGGRENLAAIDVLRDVNTQVYGSFPDAVTIAEESTAWPGVSRPAYLGGLGFGFKWDMGWMHDTLDYLSHDPVHRRYHHDRITFRQLYASSENFVLPLSHDEVVHGKGSLLGKMPGDDWQQFANLRLLYGYEWAVPGKKLLFMGGELAERREWDHESSLDWSLAASPAHAGVARWLGHLNALYRREPALHEGDHDPAGFEWIDCRDHEHSVVCFERRSLDGRAVVVVVNFTPVPRDPYRVGLPGPGPWYVVANSDDPQYWGSAYPGPPAYRAEPQPWHDRDWSAPLVLPPLSVLVLAPEPWS